MPVPFGSAWQPRLLLKHGARPLLAALQTHGTRLTAHQHSCLHPLLHTSFSPCIVSVFRGVTTSSGSDSVGSGPRGVDGRAGPRLCVLGLFLEGVNLIIVSHPRVGRGDLGGGPLDGGRGRFPS